MASDGKITSIEMPTEIQIEKMARPMVVPGWPLPFLIPITIVNAHAAIIVTGQASELPRTDEAWPHSDQAIAT